MLVGEAKQIARRWVTEEGRKTPGFQGAYLAGSMSWLADGCPLPVGSDVDVMVVLADLRPPNKPGKLLYQGALLEVSYLPAEKLQSPEQVLADYHLAGGFRTPSVLADPTGRLTRLQAAVSAGFAKRRWVYRRCEHARSGALEYLQPPRESAPLHEQVLAWLFGTGRIAHVLLVAGLRNPTVRRRYAAVRELLEEAGRLDLHETLLESLGCARISPERVERHLDALAEAFDATAAVIRMPLPFASDLSEIARPIAIDGSRDLLRRGLHREAVFWIAVTYSRCRTALWLDAPVEVRERYEPGYRRLLGDLGIASSDGLKERREHARGTLPRVWEAAQAILAANPEVVD